MNLGIAIYRLLIILLSLLMPQLAAAASGDASAIVNRGPNGDWSDIGTIAYSAFDPNPSDISIVLLRKLFGSVGGALVATQDQLLGHLLGIFNQGIWVIAGGVVSFVVVTTVLHTAKEGELMGQRTNMLSLYKAVVGMTLLIPKASGYSFIQIIVMWAVVQGVNLADNIWTTALSYLDQGGVVAANPSPDRYKTALPVVQNVLESEVCMYFMQLYDQDNQKNSRKNFKPCPPNPTPIEYLRCHQNLALANQPIQYFPDYSLDGFQVSFGTRPLGSAPSIDTKGMCGVYSWKTLPPSQQAQMAMGMRQLVTELLPVAYQIAQNAWTSAAIQKDKENGVLSSFALQPPLPDPCLSTKANSIPPSCDTVPPLQAAAAHYFDAVQPPKANTGNGERLNLASKYGWAIAGVFYRDLIKSVSPDSSPGLSSNNIISNTANPGLPRLVSVQPPTVPPSTRLDTSINPKITGDNGYFIRNNLPYILPMQLAFQAIEDESPVASNYMKKTREVFDQLMAAWNAANAANKNFTSLLMYTPAPITYTLTSPKPFSPQMDNLNPNSEASPETETVSIVFNIDPTEFIDYKMKNFSDNFSSMDYLVARDVDKMIQTLWDSWKRLTLSGGSGLQVRDLIGAMSAFGVELMQAVLTFWPSVTAHVWEEVTGIAVAFTLLSGIISGISGWVQELGIAFRKIITLFPPAIIPLGLPSIVLQMAGFSGFQLSSTMPLFFKVTLTCIFWYLPIFLYVGVPIFITGVLLGVYAPMIPYLLFTFGVFGWFVAVIEAMVAGPLIALGICHPAGQHDYLGRAEQAVMLLMNILLRPAAMIIGLLAGTVLSFITLQLLNIGFANAFAKSQAAIKLSTNLGNLGFFTVMMTFIVLYTTMALTLINRCFALIYAVPDRLTRWLGAQAEQSMADSVLEHIKGGMTRSVQAVAGSQSQVGMEATKSVSASPVSMMGGLGPKKGK